MFTEEAEADKLDDTWMIRPCEFYLDEFKECTGVRGRFHQLYTLGHKIDCTKWKEDYNNCVAFQRSNSAADAEKVIANERQRRKERLTGARGNNVWTYRTVPPESFSRPLPEHMLRNAVPSLLDKSTENSCLIS